MKIKCKLTKSKCWVFFTVVFVVALFLYHKIGINSFRLDQYAETICTTTAGIVGTMFGLTAASYAFRCSDLRNESQDNPHLQKVLGIYMDSLWRAFIYSLAFTIVTIISSLIILFCMQQFTSPLSYKVSFYPDNSLVSYFSVSSKWINCCISFNFIVSLISIIIMAAMNRAIFRREEKHTRIAKEILNEVRNIYSFSLDIPGKNNITYYEECEKIHNLEILIKRILKNHESMGEAYPEEHRRKNLLTAIIRQTLTSEYQVDRESIPGSINDQFWTNLEKSKRNDRWKQCFYIAKRDYDNITCDRISARCEETKLIPEECNFIHVYDHLLTCRDSKLVISITEPTSFKSINENESTERELRYTIKRRLLLFFLKGEDLSNMDLSRISFSGADLRYTNFSGSNLSGIRLKGANCKCADFSGTKMSGMYFCDVINSQYGEIQLTCLDDHDTCWDAYKGKEITFLKGATFTDADVSRACLNASNADLFSLAETNFDRAKMYSSLYNNIDFTSSSLVQAQIYNSAFKKVIAKSANFSKSIMTKCHISQSELINANFGETLLADSFLYKSDFSGAKLISANFTNCSIISCCFENASCQNVSFKNIVQIVPTNSAALENMTIDRSEYTSFRFTILARTDFSGADLTRMSFENAMGSECIFIKTKGHTSVFNGAILIGSILNKSVFYNCSFHDTILQNSIIIDSKFISCRFKGTDFSSVLFDMKYSCCFINGDFKGVNFSNCQGLTAGNFKKCVLNEVIFTGTGLQEVDFAEDVIIDKCIF